MEITVKEKTSGREITVDYDLGEVEGNSKASLDGACKLFGEDAVWNHAKGELITSVRDRIRPKLAAGISDADIVADLQTYKIGVRTSRAKDPMEKVMQLLAALPADKREQVLAMIQT